MKKENRIKLIEALNDLQNRGLFIHKAEFKNLRFKIDPFRERPVYLIETLAIINCLVSKGSMLFYGGHGGGKTTFSKYLGQIILGKSESEIEKSMLRGHPQLTEEKILGTLNISQLLRPETVEDNKIQVIWSNFIKSSWKIIDEVNRLNHYAQDIILSLLAEGIVKYYDQYYECDDYSLFATMNPEDEGTFKLPLPFLDRFSIAVPITMPDYESIKAIGLRDNKLEAPKISKRGVIEEDIDEIRNEINDYSIQNDAEEFINQIFLDFRLCVKVPKEVSENLHVNNGLCSLDGGCRYKVDKNVCWKIQNPLSVRAKQDFFRYSKALSWYLGDKEVNLEHVSSIAPFIVWHRTKFLRDFLNDKVQYQEDEQGIAKEKIYRFRLNAAKKIINDIKDNFKKRKKFIKSYNKIYDTNNTEINDIIKELKDYSEDDLFVGELYRLAVDYNQEGSDLSQLRKKIEEVDSLEELQRVQAELEAKFYRLPNRIKLIQKLEARRQKLKYKLFQGHSCTMSEEELKEMINKCKDEDFKSQIQKELGKELEHKKLLYFYEYQIDSDIIKIKFYKPTDKLKVKCEIHGELKSEFAKKLELYGQKK